MRIFNTSEVDFSVLPQRDIDYIYNGLDCCITHELVDKLRPKLDRHTSQIHNFTSSLQNICLDMTLSGILIDQQAKARIVRETTKQLQEAESLLNELSEAFWGKPLNPKSPKQCADFFYGFLALPPIYKRGSKGPTTDDQALEKLKTYFWARPFISLIKTVRDYKKKLEALNAKISPDGRMRGQFKATGTETGRFSSSKNVFNEGLNLQNQNEYAKRMYVADPGYKLAYIDLEQAESRMLAAFIYGLFGDSAYLDACESGDLHTTVCKMIWPDLQWSGDSRSDRAIADSPFYRHFSHRDMSKRGGHGCLTPEHEVLTPDGWVPITDKPAKIMAWDAETAKMRWEEPSHWEDKEWHGDLYEMRGNQYSMCCTSDHRMPLFKKGSGIYDEKPAEQMMNFPGHNLKQFGVFQGGNADISERDARLLAAIMADGYIYPNGTVQFGFSRERKIKRIDGLLQGIPHKKRVNNREETVYLIYARDLAFKPTKSCGAEMLNWPLQSLKAWVEEAPYWDGTRQKNFTWIYGKDRNYMDWLRTLATVTGQSCSYSPNPGHDCARVGFNRRRNRRVGSLKVTKKHGNGVRVYCPTVPSGGFLYRRGVEVGFSSNTNYYGKPAQMAKNLNVSPLLMTNFQDAYFTAFPGIPQYHEWVIHTLQTTRTLINPFGRKRVFFGRPSDDATVREAIAYMPQSSIGDLMNLGMWKVWKQYGRKSLQLLAQVHDAILIQYPESLEHTIVPALLDLIPHPLQARDRQVWIPCTAETGWNWAHIDPKKKLWPDTNPDGLMEYTGNDSRKRSSNPEKANSILGRVLF